MTAELSNKAKHKMEDVLTFLKRDLDSVSTGRANPSLLDTVRVEAYEQLMPIVQVASIAIPDATTLAIQAWDREMVKPIEKAIINANLGFNPMVDGQIIRISIPKLSQERRIEMVKLVKKYGEDKKVSVRNVRRDILDEFKKREKELSASKDQIHAFGEVIQKITDEYIKKIDELIAAKEKDLMTI